MSNRNYATRMSCFSLISAIETDLRNIIVHEMDCIEEASLPADVVAIAKTRYEEHNKKTFSRASDEIRSLLDFIDFYDLVKILNKISNTQSTFTQDELLFLIKGLERLSACRNRVCHSRPLEASDFTELLDFAKDLKNTGARINWENINTAAKNLDNPAFALTLSIPDFWKNQRRAIYNNLPLPEFDDIGFIGRDKDRKSINTLLASNTKVISIVGEGGIGKTALAQRCLYDVLEICEDPSCDTPPYDIIIWVSLKTNRLTSSGIEHIRNAISSGTGLFKNIGSALGASQTDNLENALNEVCMYMEEFKVLLCIDNLETISSNEVRGFLANVPPKSKILITTRMGLGEIEYRYKLDKLDDKPSVQLMRSLSKILNIEKIYKKKNDSLIDICRRLYNNPLLIKWYVLSVAAGQNPEEIVNRQSEGFKEALKFCFENLYDRLSDIEVKVVSVIACWRKPVSAVELRFILDGTDDVAIEEALNQLHNSSMLESNSDYSDSRTYSLTGVAFEFITTLRPSSKEIYELVKSKRKELQAILDQQNIIQNHYNYDLNSIYWSTRDENICAIYLKKALTEYRRGRNDLAEENINTAKAMMPVFSECYRINAFILRDSPFQAQTELEHAIELNPKSSLTRYAYAQFSIREEDYENAEEQIDAALIIDPEDIALRTCKAWILTLTGRYKIASKIYEEIIPHQKSRHKKFRLSTFDQATNCHIRMAEQLLKDGDYPESKRTLLRAGEILSEAIRDGDYDPVSISKLFKLLATAELYFSRCADSSITLDVLTTIDAYADIFTGQCLSIVTEELKKYCTTTDSPNKIKAKNILERLSGPDVKFGARMSGRIIRVVDSDRGVSFGFVIGENSQEYFFHRSYLRPNNILDGKSHDVKITFSPGRSDKGLCAFDIDVVTEA